MLDKENNSDSDSEGPWTLPPPPGQDLETANNDKKRKIEESIISGNIPYFKQTYF
jgi:hypothetical protein